MSTGIIMMEKTGICANILDPYINQGNLIINFLCFSTPRFIAVYTTLLMPEMHIGEAYENMYVFLWALTALFASVNASVNIFIYLTVNSAYRAVFRQLFWCCSRNDQGKVDDEDRTEGRD